MGAVAKTGPAPLIDETDFVPADLAQARRLYEAMVHAGTPRSQARGILAWLITLPDSGPYDPSSAVMRSRYRKELVKLGEPPWRGEPSEYTGALLSSQRGRRSRRQGRARAGGLWRSPKALAA